MPGRDRTGPMGQGPRTGRGAGRCGGEVIEAGPRGRGWGLGRGGGWRHRGGAGERLTSADPGQELTGLRQQLAQVEQHLRELTAKVEERRDPPAAPEGDHQ
jgi:hypothetical protein